MLYIVTGLVLIYLKIKDIKNKEKDENVLLLIVGILAVIYGVLDVAKIL